MSNVQWAVLFQAGCVPADSFVQIYKCIAHPNAKLQNIMRQQATADIEQRN
jgi:hypothetical protein